jgi:anti-sigma B factor antagonist
VNTLLAPVSGCRIELRPDRERVLVLLDGELDLAAVESIEGELGALRSAGWRQVVLDLGAVSFMDLAGVRLLLGAFEQADRVGSLFAVVAASPQVRRIIELTGNIQVLEGAELGRATASARRGCSLGRVDEDPSIRTVLTMHAERARVPAPDQEST